MGVFLDTAVVQNKGLEEIKAGIQKTAKEYSDMNIISEKCVFKNSDKGALIIFNEEANVGETLVKALSREICAPVMYFYIYDSDGWGYFYCEDGVIKDSFSVCFEDEKNTSSERYKDSAGFIAKQFHINVNDIIRYYKIWTEELIEDEAVAYEDDEFVYGDCWQMVDFMNKLGISFPDGSDNKENKKAVSKGENPGRVSEPKVFYDYGSSTSYVCAFDYSYKVILMERYQSSLQDIIKAEELGKHRQAREELTKKIDSLKDNCNSDEERRFLSDMYILRGSLSRTIGNNWLAGKDLDAAYELEPENVYILRQRVQLGTSKGKAKKDISDLNTLMRIDEKNYDSYLVERAWCYYWIEEMEAARNDLMEAMNRSNSGKNDDFVFLCKKLRVTETTMRTDELINYMKNQGWTAEKNEEQKFCLPEPMKSRYTDYPESWAEFVSIVKQMVREDEKAWFLCSEDYDLQGDKAWQWNEWELLSLEAAENDAAWKDEIRKFWDGHLPIFLSLGNGYAYYAISIKEGSIVYGCEPEFEECQTVADSFEDFMKKIISGEISL